MYQSIVKRVDTFTCYYKFLSLFCLKSDDKIDSHVYDDSPKTISESSYRLVHIRLFISSYMWTNTRFLLHNTALCTLWQNGLLIKINLACILKTKWSILCNLLSEVWMVYCITNTILYGFCSTGTSMNHNWCLFDSECMSYKQYNFTHHWSSRVIQTIQVVLTEQD